MKNVTKSLFLGIILLFILSPSGIFADVDTDGDGISDSIDQCPTQAETINEFQDTDGCPDVAPVSESVPTSKSEQDNSFFQWAAVATALITTVGAI